MNKNPNTPVVTVKVIDPTTGEPVSIEEWIEQPDTVRESAEWILFESGEFRFQMHKKELPERTWTKQQKAAAEAQQGGRCGTRIEWLLLQYYRESDQFEINDLLSSIGGDIIRSDWYWTEECFAGPAYFAWLFYGHTYGPLYFYSNRVNAYSARVFRAF